MPQSLADWEARRSEILQQMASAGDFRRGSITPTFGKCGQPTCHCAQPNDPGHGPNFRLTHRRKGKTVTESFPSPLALRKAQQEVTAFHRFQDLCQERIAVNEPIGRLRPAEQILTPQEKKRPQRSSKKSIKK